MQENSSDDFDCDICLEMRLNGPMLRNNLNFEERFLVRSGSSPWKEFIGTAVALARFLPILSSMVENGDSRFPKTTPPGKSLNRAAESPGIKSEISLSGPTEPVHANALVHVYKWKNTKVINKKKYSIII